MVMMMMMMMMTTVMCPFEHLRMRSPFGSFSSQAYTIIVPNYYTPFYKDPQKVSLSLGNSHFRRPEQSFWPVLWPLVEGLLGCC